ncbi:MAG: IMP-specific 5-nucleotidase, partial [Olpidium bornovanus]
HKRDDFIEFLKSTLLTPFVLHAKPRDISDGDRLSDTTKQLSRENFMDDNLKRYAETMQNVEALVDEHIVMQSKGTPHHSRLKRLVPSVGVFFTPLPLREAFLNANKKYSISARRSVPPRCAPFERPLLPPSFNDIRRILNTAQVLAVAPQLKLITFAPTSANHARSSGRKGAKL